MLQKLPSRKSPCSSPLFAPLSSRMGLFHRPNTGFLCFPDRTLEEGSRRGRGSERAADIDCSRAWRSPFFHPPSVSSIAATKSVAADLSSSFLTDQTAVVVWFFIARCRAAFFGWKKKERGRATAWQPSSQGTVVQYNLPSRLSPLLGNATTSSRCRSTPRCPAGQPWRKN